MKNQISDNFQVTLVGNANEHQAVREAKRKISFVVRKKLSEGNKILNVHVSASNSKDSNEYLTLTDIIENGFGKSYTKFINSEKYSDAVYVLKRYLMKKIRQGFIPSDSEFQSVLVKYCLDLNPGEASVFTANSLMLFCEITEKIKNAAV